MSSNQNFRILHTAEETLRYFDGRGRAGGATSQEIFDRVLEKDPKRGPLFSLEALENALSRAVKSGRFDHSPDGRYWLKGPRTVFLVGHAEWAEHPISKRLGLTHWSVSPKCWFPINRSALVEQP